MVALGIVSTGQELYDALLTLRMIEPEQVSNVCIHRWALGRLGGMVQGTYDSPQRDCDANPTYLVQP
jgi:hypothetical protein